MFISELFGICYKTKETCQIKRVIEKYIVVWSSGKHKNENEWTRFKCINVDKSQKHNIVGKKMLSIVIAPNI